jgi:polysaccharide chain length determinant protein (PEP-CTERM system associated)
MINADKNFNFRDYLEIGLRRKWYIIIPLVVSIFVAYGVYKYMPKIYKASTLILVLPQRVPESYVRSIITDSITSRLNTISQEILSRTRLEKVIQELNLYPELRDKLPMEGIIERMRKMIEVTVQTNPQNERMQNSFSISFEGKDPQAVMMVTNKLASLFIEENLKVREFQAESTSNFLVKELQSMADQLKRKEQEIRNFKERSMGQLPQQLDANLRILERLQQELQTTSENLRAAEDRRVLIQNQIEQLKAGGEFSTSRGIRRDQVSGAEEIDREQIQGDSLVTQLNNLKKDLANAQSRYKESHPDVIYLQKRIAALEPKVKELLEKQEAERKGRMKKLQEGGTEEDLSPPTLDPRTQMFLIQYTEQYNSALLEARRANEEVKNLKEQIALYQKRIEDTPKREQELTLLTRDYELMKNNYQSLLDKKIQAQMSENLERKQQGEQFKILDPACLPEKPFRPDRNKILLVGIAVGLAMGLGLAWFRESIDQSFYEVSDLETNLGLPVLATILNLKEEKKKAA